MAASLEERLKLKQYQVDTWTTREQLCLASAVMRSGDQNWVAVRRNIKMLTNESGRPHDWYSTKNCALQYAKLLERVDTPKRKREKGDGGNETPGEIVTKMLSKQRIEELRGLESEERTTYTRLRQEIQQLEAGLLDHNLNAMWDQLVKEQGEEDEEEQRHQQWLKERDEKITAIQQALKHQGPKMSKPPIKKPKSHSNVGSAAASRRNSGVSETSSEVDSTVDSPDVTETTPSQDEGGGVGSSVSGGGEGGEVAKPTPASPLLTNLLNKSPLTHTPLPHSTSPLSQGGVRGVRGIGISPVSEALQNLVTSAISGTDTADKDKTPHTPTSGSSTLSRLLDLPPSTPGGPLPRLSDLPEPTFHQKAQDKKFDLLRKSIKESESCGETKGCGEDNNKACSSKESAPKTVEIKKEEDSKETECKSEVKETSLSKETEVKKEEPEESHTEEKTKIKEPQPPDEKEAKLTDEKTKEKEIAKEEEENQKNVIKTEGEMKEDEDSNSDISSKLFEKDGKDGTPDTGKTEDDDAEEEVDEEKGGDEDEAGGKKSKEESNKLEVPKDEVDKVLSETLPENKEDTEKDKTIFDEDSTSKISPNEDSFTSLEMDKRPRKTYSRRDQEEEDSNILFLAPTNPRGSSSGQLYDIHVCPSSRPGFDTSWEPNYNKDWVSEEESSSVSSSSRKRKISGGDPTGCLSPLITESAPNSPASTHFGDDSESEKAYRSWKKPIMILWNKIAEHKYASLFLRPITDDKAPGYHSVVYRPMDLQKIKRSIESGLIRTTAEFQRDIMLMFMNATMYNTRDHNVFHMAHLMMKDAVATIEEFLNTQMLARADDTPQKLLRRETRESSAKRTEDDPKRKRDSQDDKSLKKRRI